MFFGDLGSGKTLGATFLATQTTDKPIYSNYTLKLDNYRDLKPEMLRTINEPSLIILDEAYAWLESRLSGRDINLYMSYILFQSRKRQMDFILTLQLIGTIDIRFRNMVNYLVECHVVEEGFQYTFYKNSNEYYAPVSIVIPFEEAEKLYPIYDTWQKIDPIDNDMMANITMRSNPDELNDNINDIAIEIVDSFHGKKITKAYVKDWMLQHKKPLNYSEFVYNRIKTMTDS